MRNFLVQPLTDNLSRFQQLYETKELVNLDEAFLSFLAGIDNDVFQRLVEGRSCPEQLTKKQESSLLIEMAPYLENFLIDLFDIQLIVAKGYREQSELSPLYICKRSFIQKRVAKNFAATQVENSDPRELRRSLQELFQEPFSDLSFAKHVIQWMQDQKTYDLELGLATSYATWAIFTKEGRLFHRQTLLFKIPEKIDPFNLIPIEVSTNKDINFKYSLHVRHRDGFALTDPGIIPGKAIDQVNYCIWCHNQSKDSCSKGLVADDSSKRYEENVFKV